MVWSQNKDEKLKINLKKERGIYATDPMYKKNYLMK